MKSFNVEEFFIKFLWVSEIGIWNWVVILIIKLIVGNIIILGFCYISGFIYIFCVVY